MLRVAARCLGPFRVQYVDQNTTPSPPAAQRWDLRLARARLWDEYIDEQMPASYQVEDERHMSPEFDSFIGQPIRTMRPGEETLGRPQRLINKRLPNATALEIHARKTAPYPDNLKFGKLLFDKTIHGFSQPYAYSFFKSIQKSKRNDRKLTQNKFRVMIASGAKNPPDGVQHIPDPVEEEKEDPKKKK